MLLLISVVFVFISNIVLGVFTYLNNPKNRSNQAFAIMCSTLSLWALFNYLADADLTNALTWNRLTFFVISYSLCFLILFMNNFPSQIYKARFLNLGLLSLGTIIALISLHPIFIPTVKIIDGVSNVEVGPLYPIFPVYLLAFLIGMGVLLTKSWRNSTGYNRVKMRFLIFGISAMALLASITNLFLPLITGTNEYAKFGALFTLIFVGSTSYAIVRHKLFDIRLIVARSVTYLFSIVTIGVAYGLITFWLVDTLLFGSSNRGSVSQNTVNTLLAVMLAFTFQPIRGFFEKVTDKIFFRDKYDAQLLINTIGRILSSEIELESLTTKVVHEIKKQMRIVHADIIVLEDNKEHVFFDAGHLQNKVAIHHRDLAKLGSSMVVADDLAGGERKEIMQNYKRSIASPLRANKQLIGYLFLGDKMSGDAYSNGDIEVVKIIVNELAVAVQNAKSYTEIQRFNETLQEKITEATRKLRKANEDLKTLDQAKDEFISMASHQLRTPLTTAKGYVSMVLDGDFGKLPTKMKPPLDQALDSSNRMAGLINDLLNVSRMDAGKFFIDAVDVDLALEVQGEVNQLANLAQSKSVVITYHPPKKKIPIIKLDLDKTRQVIMNIADNAVHYSAPPAGGGKADVYLDLEGDEVVFKVVDNGIGVPDDIKPKLFAKFFRAGNAQSARPDGTGLGLYLVKRVVEDQGGTIIFESTVGKGSTFGFRMPIHNKLKIDKEAAKRLQNTA
jgi:signal transduction histidine kinase